MVAPRLPAPRRHFVPDEKCRFPLKDTAFNSRVWGRPGVGVGDGDVGSVRGAWQPLLNHAVDEG